jgi:RNA polymerase sigma-70 factor (ECF subfamily)
MTRPETEVTASDFAGHTRCTEPKLGSTPKRRHDRAPFIDGRTGYPFDVSVTAVEGGEANTVKGLYDEHAAAVWRYAWRLTGDPARAQDVVQETLLRAWQHPEVALDNERSARSWLFTVARNIIIDETRCLRFRREVSALDGSGAPERACPDEVNAALDRMLIGEALARLTPEHRAVVQRSYFQGWSTAQIAADLGIADGTVKSRLHYALRALRLALSEIGVTP